MSRGDDERLRDMLEALDDLLELRRRGSEAFFADRLLQLAAERALMTLGEAAKSVSAEVRAQHDEVPWSELARTRDLMAHHYHRVDAHLVWAIVDDEAAGIRRSVAGLAVDEPSDAEP